MKLSLLLDLVYGFATLGFIEAVVKPIAMRFVRAKLLKYSPLVLDALDPVMPELIAKYDGQELEIIVREKFEELTGDDWSKENLEPFWRLYDPRKNADKYN